MDTNPKLMNTSPVSASTPSIPKTAILAGVLLILPSWLLTLSVLFETVLTPVMALFSLNIYSAILIGFFAATGWAIAILSPSAKHRGLIVFVNVVFVLFAAFAAIPILQADLNLIILMTVLALQWFFDVLMSLGQARISGLLQLRTVMTLSTLLSLALAWWILV
ncbi:hypothetical protein [Orrella sp. 11846]|uniref:hypothetical protein n=1 Tax=Orrella sp. 11846 TaxID=3409913 RepID=UPI003B59DEBA